MTEPSTSQQIAALKARLVQTGGHGRRQRIEQQIAALEGAEQHAWSAAGDMIFDLAAPADNPDAWGLAREAIASALLGAPMSDPKHAPGRPALNDKRTPAIKLNSDERKRYSAAALAAGYSNRSAWLRAVAEAEILRMNK